MKLQIDAASTWTGNDNAKSNVKKLYGDKINIRKIVGSIPEQYYVEINTLDELIEFSKTIKHSLLIDKRGIIIYDNPMEC